MVFQRLAVQWLGKAYAAGLYFLQHRSAVTADSFNPGSFLIFLKMLIEEAGDPPLNLASNDGWIIAG
jgi:hypothetical protein